MSDSVPKVTVLMAVYNGEDYLAESVDSILGQSYGDFEFLIVDDCSTDGTGDILGDYVSTDNRVRVLKNEMNKGLPSSLNLGLAQSRGDLIARQDADDLSAPHRLQMQVALFEDRDDLAAVGSWFESLDESGTPYGWSQPSDSSPTIQEQLSAGTNPLAHGSVMFQKKAILDLGGYDERFWFGQDFDLWLRLFAREGASAAIVPDYLYKRRKLPSSSIFKTLCQARAGELALEQHQSGNRIEFQDIREWVREHHPGSEQQDPAVIGKYWILLAITAMNHKKRKLARAYGRKALGIPRLGTRLKGVCLIALSLLPMNLLKLRSSS
jgi:hypothetical protein